MALWSLGSVSERVYNSIDNVPTSLSGTETIEAAQRQRLFMEEYTGQSIGSVGIAEKYQPALFHLTAGEISESMGLVGGDASTLKIGEFEVKKGSQSNTSTYAQRFTDKGMAELRAIGRKRHYYKAIG